MFFVNSLRRSAIALVGNVIKETKCNNHTLLNRSLSLSWFSQKELRNSVAAQVSALRDVNPTDTDGTVVARRINAELQQGSTGRLFAVVQLCGVQRKVTAEDIVVWHGNLPADVGEVIRLEKVLLVGSRDFSIVGRPVLSREQVRVEATVIEKCLEQNKVLAYYKRRKRTRKMKPYQQPLAFLRINSIHLRSVPQEATGEEHKVIDS